MKSYRLFYWIFVVSGATGLVYEVIWVRLTGLVFGNTAHAIATVLGAFMAGLAVGSWKLGQFADRVKRPLRMYGMLEIGIGLSAAVVPFLFQSLQNVYWTLAPALESIPGGDPFIRFATSFVVLLVPTFLMGGTLPVLTRFFTRSVDEVERKVGVLYALNTFGAAAGTLAAALVLIPYLGNLRTTLIIAGINIAIGVFAIWLDGREIGARTADFDSSLAPEEGNSVVLPPVSVEVARPADRLVLGTLAVSGFVSMLYEVAWTRALTAIIGSSTYAFSIMLVTFLAGIALGSSIVGRFRPVANLRTLGLAQLGIAIGGTIFLVGYVVAPYALISLLRAFYYSFPAVLTAQFIMSAALMILATLCMGATFPIASQLYSNKYTILGRSIGNIYSINTIGAIAGSLAAGFLFLPLIGTERTILVGLFFSSAIALLLLSESSGPRQFGKWAALVLLLVATFSMRGGVFWQPDLMDRGILIYAAQFAARPELKIAEHYEDTDIVYFKEGRNATISVRKGENYLGLRTNGKVDASNRDDMATQTIIAYLAGFHHPAPRSAMIIGYGSGVTVGAMTAFKEIEEIDCVEIEPAVFAAAPLFSEINRKSHENPKVRLIFNDARNYMNITRKQYDIILSEPSNPWIAGVASLFTAEFYERAAQVLKPDGVFVQWIQLYELDPEDLKMIMWEFQQKFPEVSVWNSGAGDLILIGTRQPQRLDLHRVAQLSLSDPEIVRDYWEYLDMTRPEGILAYYVMSTDEVRKFAQTSRRNTDDHPLLEFHAPRRLFTDTVGLNLDLLYEGKAGLVPPGAEIHDPETTYSAMIEPFLAMNRSNYANQAMAMLSKTERKEEARLPLAIARLNLDTGNLEKARSSLEQASASLTNTGPIFAEHQELLGMLDDRSGETAGAIEHFRRAVAADPRRPLSLQKLATLSAQNQSWDEAARWMEQYISTRPQPLGHYWAMLGDYQFAAENPAEGLRALETALHIDPYSYWARYRMARLLEERKQSDDAIEQYEFVLRYSYDRDPDVYLKLANLHKAAGNTDRALEVLEKGTRIFPSNAAIYRLYQETLVAE
jgi:spermidine synthase